MRFTLAELAEHLHAELVGSRDPADAIEGLAIDSRLTVAGRLFAALTDERDGHDFVGAARDQGAAAALVERIVDDGPSLRVGDVRAALAEMAHRARERLQGHVIGITGSVGKTTTKDLMAAALRTELSVTASEGSFNNELGVPLTLANAAEETKATVLEMGARGAGHISLLCSMAEPTVGVVTAVRAVHTEVMGDEDDIARAKAELVEALPPRGLAVLNADDPRVAAMAQRTDAELLTFGSGPGADVRCRDTVLGDDLRARFTVESPWGGFDVHLGARGVHNVHNALAAAAVALWAGVSPQGVVAGLAQPLASRWRMELVRCASGLVVLNDAYNAGPASMEAALRALATVRAPRRVAVLGEMAELGTRSVEEHQRIGALASELGMEVVAVGTELYGPAADAVHYSDAIRESRDARSVVGSIDAAGLLGPGVAVLVKGSRVTGLEAVADALVEYAGGPAVD